MRLTEAEGGSPPHQTELEAYHVQWPEEVRVEIENKDGEKLS